MTLSIHKPSFWKSRREVRDASGAVLGFIEVKGWTCNKAVGEAQGKQLLFGHSGWDNQHARMTDASDQNVATIQRIGWWGTQYKLTYGAAEYVWKINGWSSTFSIRQNEADVVTVRRGGHFKPGSVTIHRAMDEKDLVPLILFGLYQMYQYEIQVSAIATVSVVIIGTASS